MIHKSKLWQAIHDQHWELITSIENQIDAEIQKVVDAPNNCVVELRLTQKFDEIPQVVREFIADMYISCEWSECRIYPHIHNMGEVKWSGLGAIPQELRELHLTAVAAVVLR